MNDIECQQLLVKADEHFRQGREEAARSLWRQILVQRPQDTAALDALAQSLFRSGDFEEALQLFTQLTSLKPWEPMHWVQSALSCQQLGRVEQEEQALLAALKADPHDLLALIVRGEFLERHGRRHEASRAYGAALQVAPPLDQLHPQLRPALEQAQRFHAQYQRELAEHMDARMAAARQALGQREGLERFDLSLDILLGRKRRFESQPMRYFVPSLRPVEFLDRALFPWIESVEARTADIREEFRAVLQAEADWQPYIQYREDQPLAQWRELNQSRQWSAYHLWKDGQPVVDHLERCPITARTLRATPQPDQPGRTPVGMFSLLKPRTRIPPHVGASNARLVCHLPLVVPKGCGFRVGNQTRQWEEGRAWVFDDTIEHEAWNDSDDWRVVLIWDTWHPELSQVERAMITEMNAALQSFVGGEEGYGA